MNPSLYPSGKLLKAENQVWNLKDSFLCGFSVSFILAEIMLFVFFVHKVYKKNDRKIFGNKITRFLNIQISVTTFMLILQGIVYLIMLLTSKNVTSGLTCSIFNYVFHTLHLFLNFLNVLNLFSFHYIWIQQKVLRFLHLRSTLYDFLKGSIFFVVSASITIPFKIKIDTVFVLADGLCLGKRHSFQEDLLLGSIIAAFSVSITVIIIHVYYLYLTEKEGTQFRSTRQNEIVFWLIHNQIFLFLKLFSVIAFLFALYLVTFLVIKPDKYTKFADFKYLVCHIYNFIFCFILCVFRFTVSKLNMIDNYKDQKTKYFKLQNVCLNKI